MKAPMNQPGGHVLAGILQLALLRAEGISQFGSSRQSFLNSLAPLLAFPLVGGAIDLLSGASLDDMAALLGSLVALLTPPVLSETVAGRFGRQREWLRYATAFNWTRWTMLPALAAALLLMGLLAASGLEQQIAVAVGLVAVAAYAVVLDCFVARVGLLLSWWRAASVVIVVNLGTALLLFGPRVVAWLQEGSPS